MIKQEISTKIQFSNQTKKLDVEKVKHCHHFFHKQNTKLDISDIISNKNTKIDQTNTGNV